MILLISHQDPTTDLICKWLNILGKKYIRINEAQFINAINIDINNNQVTLNINDCVIDLKTIKSIFYRNGAIKFGLNNSFEMTSDQIDFHYKEWEEIVDYLKYYIKKNNIRVFGNLFLPRLNKLIVLSKAIEFGLKVPSTQIISQKNDLIALLQKNRHLITKSIYESIPLIKDKKMYLNYTQKVKLNSDLSDNFMPTLIQNQIIKKYGIRTFFIENHFWSIAIFSQQNNQTSIDSRNYNYQNPNHSDSFNLPPELKEKILKLSNTLGLNSGSIDWMYSTEGDYYFLEINPNGQFGNVSLFGNFQIEKHLASIL